MTTTTARKFDLDKARIASPCSMSWNEMKGDDRERHCGSCKLNVYNVAGLTKVEAEELLERRAGGERVCVRLMRRKDGTIITKDCPVGVSLARRAKLRVASLSASIVALCIGLFSVRSIAQEEETMGEPAVAVAYEPVLMGKVAFPSNYEDDVAMMGGLQAPIDENGEVEVLTGDIAEPVPTIEYRSTIEPHFGPSDNPSQGVQ
ncbi:MAG: hypothetical protein V4760_19545, partial [Bdellovibrionota bacterium]